MSTLIWAQERNSYAAHSQLTFEDSHTLGYLALAL